ncbi:MAG: hypothetical protein EB075_09165, partial [Bacteroidetes bacterium]|nr:hypothetical protein [Bacteroidota bacterium]
LVQADNYWNKWTSSSTPYDAEFDLSWGGGSNNGANGSFAADVTVGTYYTFQLVNNGYASTRAVVMKTSASPVAIATVGDLSSSRIYPGDAATISVTLDSDKSAEERVFIRYTTDGFATSSVVEATMTTGTAGSATIPSGVNTTGTTVTYYAYTTTVAATSGSNHDLITLSLGNNGGSNYAYTITNPQSTQAGTWGDTSTWLDGRAPATGETVEIAHDVTVAADISVTQVSVAASKTLTVNTGTTLSLGGGLTGDGALAIYGTLQINPSGYTSIAPTYGGSSTLTYNTGGTYAASTEWSAASGAGYPKGVTVTGNTTVSITGPKAMAGSLTVASGSTLSMGTSSGKLTVIGATNIEGSLSLGTSSGGDLELHGDLTLAASGSITDNDRAIFFEGSTVQSIDIDNGDYLDKILVNGTGGLRLGSNLTLKHGLGTLVEFGASSGGLSLNTYTLTLDDEVDGAETASDIDLIRVSGAATIAGPGTIDIRDEIIEVVDGTLTLSDNISLQGTGGAISTRLPSGESIAGSLALAASAEVTITDQAAGSVSLLSAQGQQVSMGTGAKIIAQHRIEGVDDSSGETPARSDRGYRFIGVPCAASGSFNPLDLQNPNQAAAPTGYYLGGSLLLDYAGYENLFTWDGGQWTAAYSAVDNNGDGSTSAISCQTGYTAFFFDDAYDPIGAAGNALTMSAGLTAVNANDVALTTNSGAGDSDDFFVIPNPFVSGISTSALISALSSNGDYNSTLRAWQFESHNGTSSQGSVVSYDSESAEAVLAPWTALVIESPASQPSALTIPAAAGASGSSRSFQERTSKDAGMSAVRGITLEIDQEERFMADLRIRVSPDFTVGFDRFDASAIAAPDGVGTLFGVLGEKNGTPRLKSTESLPELTGGARFDVPFESFGWDGPFTLRLTRADALPDGHALEILDRSTGQVHRLESAGDEIALISAQLGKLELAPTATATFRQVTPPPSLTAYQQRTIAHQKAGSLPRFELSV